MVIRGPTLQGTRSSIGARPGQCNHKPKKYPKYVDTAAVRLRSGCVELQQPHVGPYLNVSLNTI